MPAMKMNTFTIVLGWANYPKEPEHQRGGMKAQYTQTSVPYSKEEPVDRRRRASLPSPPRCITW